MPLTPEQYDSQFGALARYASEPARRQFGWGDRLGAAVDSAQAGLYGIGEAVGSDWAAEQRRRNQVEADYTRQRAAEDTGAPTSYQDVNGVGSGLRWVGGLLVDSAPQLATTVAAGMAAGPLGLAGTAGRLAVAGAAGYPMALGDILQNQREEAGRTDLGSAAALAVPYAAADMLGVEGALARGGLTRNAIRSLDNIKGLKGGLARTGASMARTGVEEGGGETLQEVTNQFGRMAVNPNATLTSPDAVERYKESFAGGAAMGGAFGGVGGWRRSGLTAPPRNVDQGPTDLLDTSAPPAPAAPPLLLGFRGYDTGVGEMVFMPDGSVMLRSEYDAMQRTGRRPDGSFNYLPPALSDTRQPSGEPFRYEGAIPFEPTQIPPAEPRQGGLRMRVGAPGAQVDLFDPLGEAVVEYPAARPEPDPLPPRDTATPDMLQENPTAMVPTMFNPAQPPAPVAVAAASSQRGQSIGAVAMNLRSRLVQQGAAADGFTTKLALDISQRLHSLENLQEYVQLQETELEKAQAKLDRKVTGGSNMLTPDEYAAERAKIEDRRFALEAAKELVQEYQRGRTNAQAEEARGRAAPGTQVGKAPQSRATERTMRDQNMAGAVAQNDQRVAENAVARTEQARMEILRQVMGSPSRGSAVARVRDALRANGYTNMDLSDQEMAEIRRLGQRRADVRAATVVPPGLAAAQGRLTSRASLENADASPGEPAAASPAPPAAVAGVQPAGSQRDAGVQPQPLPSADPPAAAGQQAAPTVPADGERAAALEGVTPEALVKVADTAEDTAEYEGALDELYRRWRDDGDAVAEAFFEKNATVVGFAADMARVRERAGENAPEPKTREGKRGLRMGGVGTGKLSDGAKATDALLRGLGGPKYRTVESAPQGAGTVDVDGVVAEVKKMLPGVEILVFDTPQDAGMASPPGGELAVGTMYQGRIYLFRYAIDSRLEAMRTIFHELFHKGLREMMPRDEYHRAMDRLYAADPEIQRRAHEWGRSPEAKARQEAGMSNRDLRSHAIEEALADMAEDLKTAKPGTIRAIANWMASIAERMGLKDLAQWLRRAQLTEAQKFIEEALQVAAGNPGPQGGEFVPLAQRRAEAFKPVAPPKFDRADPLGSSAFKRWFGDSKVVDAEGRPLVVYHGTGEDFSVFQNAVERGGDPTVAQTGLYFAEDSGIADIYGARDGGNVMPVYLNIRNPLDLNDTSTITGWKGALAKAIAPRLADKVMREEALRDGMSQSLITQAERDRLMAAGYDGIKGAGGVWIAFRPEQIKSAIGNRGTFDPANPDIRYKTVEPPKFDRADPLGSSTFKRWFGKSKIVTASGKPKVMYHGTARDITAFRAKQAGAIFVTDDPRFAEGFASASENWMRNNGLEVLTPEQRQEAERDAQAQIKEAYPHPKGAFEKAHVKSMLEGVRAWAEGGRLPPGEALDFIRAAAAQFVEGGQNILPLYVKAENPFDFTDPDHVTRVMRAAEAERLAEQDLTLARDLRLVERDFTDGRWSTIEHPIVQRAIRKLGFDGFYVREGGQRNLAVYSPTQLKSATGNNGAFDPANPDIRYKTKPADKAVAESFAKVPYANTTIGRTIQDALYNIAQSPWALPWTTNDQIAEGYKHIKPVVDINRATGRMAATANRYMEAAAQTAKRWRALADPVQLSMQRVMLQSTMDEMHVSIEDADGKYLSAEDAWKHASNNHLDRTPANRAKFGKLYQEFHALPASAKAVYDQVRKDLETQHEDMLRALRKGVADQYVDQLRRQLTAEELNALANEPADARRAFKDVLSVAGTRSELRALERMYQALRDINAEFGTVRGPYFPLVRFGNHVVVMKSADLQTLEDRAAAAREELQAVMEDAPAVTDPTIEAHDAKVAELRKAYNDLRKAVDTAKQDESKYVVEFHESPAQAERARLELERKNPAATVRKTVRENYYRALEGASPAFLNDLTQTLSAALDSGDGVTAKAKDTALQAMKDMYLRRQPERSALRAELKRMGIEGVQSAQMLRGYAQATRNGAWRISRLTHSGEVLEGLQALSEDRYNADAKHVLNELKARFVGDLVPPEESKVLQSLQNTTYFMHLGFNISYFATNATQAWTTSLPVMAGRHGVVNAANSLTAASKDVIRLLSQATAQSVEENGALVGLQLRLTDDQIRKLAKDEGEAKMLKALTDDGVIDITIKHDLGAISDGAATSTVGRGLQKTMELSSALANYPELYNRLATALAAYRMEAAHRGEGPETDAQVQERARQYAEKIINRTHFNYSPENAPRMMRSQLGRLVFQFKRYQQGMIYLFAKLIKDATNGDADARRSLAYLLGMTTAVGGVVSLPVAAPIALAAKVLASAYPDDDEPEWLQQWYNGMKDSVGEGVAQALVRGLPTVAGLDLSGKLGQGNLLNPVAFANTDGKKFFSRDYFMAAGFGLLGPSASLVANEAEAVGYLQNGDIVKAAERGAPTFAANIIKAYRRSQEGMTTKAGDTLMEPEEFSLLSNALKAAGFESVKVSDTYDNRSAYMNMLAARQEARKTLLRNYYEAVKTGDSDAQAEARQAISEFNQRQPADQVKPKDLAASLKQHATRAKETVGGLRVGKRDQDSYNRLMGE